MKNKRILYLILAITCSLLFLASTVGAIIIGLSNTKDYLVLYIISLALIPLSAIWASLLLAQYFTLLASNKSLLKENVYNLGDAVSFFDLSAFRIRVTRMMKRRCKKGQFIVCFSAANQSVTENINRDESVNKYNLMISEYVKELFSKKMRNHAYCFSHGLFFIYCRNYEEKDIRELVNTISDKLMKVAQENQVRIWVQPFFGVCEVERGSQLVEDVENAQVARNVSERNFETLTYYHESFRRRSSTSDTEEITEALRNNEFVVYYQPKFSLTARRFISSEALVRWNSPKHGILPPNKFIPIAEAAGLIHEIDTYVFERVCQDLNEAKRRGRRIIPVSINFSLYEFYSNDFLNSIMDMLEKYQINPSYIEIEITEATSQANTFISVSIIKKLRDRGVRVLMDDFGIGFSNIGNLRKIPFDAVKIDKSYIDDIVTDMKSRDIVHFLIELCKASDLEVIAEGVDNKEQVDILRKYKCDTIQGFYYSQALPIKEYEKFLFSNPFERKGDSEQ